MKFVYLRNSSENWRSSTRGRKKPARRSRLNRKLIWQGEISKVLRLCMLITKTFWSGLKTCPQSPGRSTPEGGDSWLAGQAAGSSEALLPRPGPAPLRCRSPWPTGQAGPAQPHAEPSIRPPRTCPAARWPPKHHPRSHHPSLSNQHLQQPALLLDLLQTPRPAPLFSPPRLSAPLTTILSLAALRQKPPAYSLSQGHDAPLSFAQRHRQPVPGTPPTGWLPEWARPSVPNANLLTQLLPPPRFPTHLSFCWGAAPPPLHLPNQVPSPWLTPSALLHITCPLLRAAIAAFPEPADPPQGHGLPPASPCCPANWTPPKRKPLEADSNYATGRCAAQTRGQTLRRAGGNASARRHRVSAWRHGGTTSSSAQCPPRDPPALSGQHGAPGSPQSGSRRSSELLPDCSAARQRLLGCATAISS